MNKSKALVNAYRYEMLDRICSLVNGYNQRMSEELTTVIYTAGENNTVV